MAVETNLTELTTVIVAGFVSNNSLATIELPAQISAHSREVAVSAPGRRLRDCHLKYRHIVKQHSNQKLASLNPSRSERRRTTCRLRLGAPHGFQAEMTARQ